MGDAGIEWGAKVPVLAACELVPSRAALIRNNFPDTKVFEGDIWKLEESCYGISNRSWKEKALAFDLVTTLPRHVLKWGGANLGSNQAGESSAGGRAQPFDSSGNKRFGKTATGLVHSRKRTENGKYGYPEREERTGKHTPLSGQPSSAWLFDPRERSGLPCLRSAPSRVRG